MNYKYVCCTGSVHALLLFFLINPDATLNNTVFFFPKDGGIRGDLKQKFKHVYWLSRKGFKYRILNYYLLKNIFKKLKLKSAKRYGFDEGGWTEYIVHTTMSFHLIEDGMNNYIMVQPTKKKYESSIIHKLLSYTPFLHIPYGLSKHVSTIYLTGIADTPQEIKDKVKFVNMKTMWNSCSEQRKHEIINLFGVSFSSFEKNRSTLIITQPLSEDKIMSEQDKIDIYKNIVQQYGETNILIKPHPREATNYKTIFPQALIWDAYFPIELLALSNQTLGIKTVITVFSTAISSFENCQKITLGSKAHPNLSFLENHKL